MENEKKTFPRELLQQSKEERYMYFKNKVIGHDRLLEVDQVVLHAIHYPTSISLILIYGPTGVGKSTLRIRIVRKLLESERETMLLDPGYLPVAWMNAIAASRSYDWRDHFDRALRATKEPLIDHKIRNSPLIGQKQEQIRRADLNELALRGSFASCAHNRRMKVFILDDAQHLNRIGSGKRHIDQMDTIKSVAEETGVIHVLIGTYDLLDLTGLSAQLCRRTVQIHFSRYNNFDDDDRDAFASVLETFQLHLPLAQTPDLLRFEDFLYEQTFGCVGVLKTLLNDAYSKALRLDAETITEEMLKESAPQTRDLIKMSSEIAEGEWTLAETDEQLAELKKFVNTPPSSTKKKKKEKVETQEASSGEAKQHETIETTVPRPKRGRKPGERNPKRDEVGRKGNVS
jgi:DNA polymerase III delta prime subunit